MDKNFDPNSPTQPGDGIFGLPYEQEDAKLVYLPVPFEGTTSYGGGTSKGPKAILDASGQVDLFDHHVLRPYEAGLCMLPEVQKIKILNQKAVLLARHIIAVGGQVADNPALQRDLVEVNEISVEVNRWVYNQTRRLLQQGKIVGLVGGDHATPYGAIKATAEVNPGMGILHFDAHHDLRKAYEGFTDSHASIFWNVLEDVPQVSRLVQVGIRDYCEEEWDYCQANRDRIRVFYHNDIARQSFSGKPFSQIIQGVVDALPQEVYVSFDIDGLDPRFCPNTGTPVPGGLDFDQANFVLGEVVRSGRKIVGFDLVEVAPDPAGQSEWDGNVGARLLYKLSAWTLASQGLAKLR